MPTSARPFLILCVMGVRILSKKEMRQLILYSPADIDRLE
jgi:hypothetical protein